MKTFMFPGQGAQKKGMGASSFDECEALEATADRILGYSIRELCLEDPRDELNRTQFTQPALYVVNAMAYERRLRGGDAPPDALIGHSLGELNALLAAGVFDFETGLRLVQKRGSLMSGAVGGGMAAVMNVGEDELLRILADNGLGGIDLANFNTPDQIVISGTREDIERAQAVFAELNKAFFQLNTSGAFHSRYMRAAKAQFDEVLATVRFAPPKIPVISNATAKPYGRDDVFANLSAQIASPVRWADSVAYLIGLGDMTFEEMGDSKVLTNLVARIKRRPKAAASSKTDGRKDAQPAPRTADEKVQQWNARHRVGTKVRSEVVKGAVLRTNTEAVVLFGHRAAVYLEGYNGYFDLDELAVAAES